MSVLKIRNEAGQWVLIQAIKGDTPYIGGNGNWWIAGVDTGISAQGTVDLQSSSVTFTEAATRVNINSGESVPTLFGKIKKFFADLGTFAYKSSLAYSELTGKPTTISGYGITDAYTKTEVDNKVASVYKFQGSVANYAALPSTGLVAGYVYNAIDTGVNWGWTGTEWDALGAVYSEATTTTAGLMSAADKTKLNGIATGAEVNVQADWNQTSNSADDYIKNKPAIIDFLTGHNAVATLASLPVTKRVVIATLNSASTLSLNGALASGMDLLIKCVNSTAGALTLTLPTTSPFESKKNDGTDISTITLPASGRVEISLVSINSVIYIKTDA